MVTGGYWGLKGVAVCYTRLQGVTKDFRGLQAVTMVTEGYKGLKDFLNGKINLFEKFETNPDSKSNSKF